MKTFEGTVQGYIIYFNCEKKQDLFGKKMLGIIQNAHWEQTSL